MAAVAVAIASLLFFMPPAVSGAPTISPEGLLFLQNGGHGSAILDLHPTTVDLFVNAHDMLDIGIEVDIPPLKPMGAMDIMEISLNASWTVNYNQDANHIQYLFTFNQPVDGITFVATFARNDYLNCTTVGGGSCGPFPVCPIGTERSTCKPCPPGSWTFDVMGGFHRFAQCTPCPDGDVGCPLCPFGSSSPSGRPPCDLCPPNTFASLEGSIECSACGEGLFAASPGATAQSQCVGCPLGSVYVPGQNCTQCPSGTFRSDPQSNKCEPCPMLGLYASSAGATACTACPPFGARANNATGWSVCADCPPGTYAGASMTGCATCPLGSAAPSQAAAACNPCPRGSFGQANGLCALCPAGKYSNAANATACKACQLAQPNSPFTTASVNFYSSLAGMQSCASCIDKSTVFANGPSIMDAPNATVEGNSIVYTILKPDQTFFEVYKDIVVDILLVGGGGGGGGFFGSGGGAGGVVFVRNFKLLAGTRYVAIVGNGGQGGGPSSVAAPGADTNFYQVNDPSWQSIVETARGGGAGKHQQGLAPGVAQAGGASGSGRKGARPCTFILTYPWYNYSISGGGGGAGADALPTSQSQCGVGGAGAYNTLFSDLFGSAYQRIAHRFKAKYYIAAGGAGASAYYDECYGVHGGCGGGSFKIRNGGNGAPFTGSGGGAAGGACTGCTGGRGASGFIMIRYSRCQPCPSGKKASYNQTICY